MPSLPMFWSIAMLDGWDVMASDQEVFFEIMVGLVGDSLLVVTIDALLMLWCICPFVLFICCVVVWMLARVLLPRWVVIRAICGNFGLRVGLYFVVDLGSVVGLSLGSRVDLSVCGTTGCSVGLSGLRDS